MSGSAPKIVASISSGKLEEHSVSNHTSISMDDENSIANDTSGTQSLRRRTAKFLSTVSDKGNSPAPSRKSSVSSVHTQNHQIKCKSCNDRVADLEISTEVYRSLLEKKRETTQQLEMKICQLQECCNTLCKERDSAVSRLKSVYDIITGSIRRDQSNNNATRPSSFSFTDNPISTILPAQPPADEWTLEEQEVKVHQILKASLHCLQEGATNIEEEPMTIADRRLNRLSTGALSRKLGCPSDLRRSTLSPSDASNPTPPLSAGLPDYSPSDSGSEVYNATANNSFTVPYPFANQERFSRSDSRAAFKRVSSEIDGNPSQRMYCLAIASFGKDIPDTCDCSSCERKRLAGVEHLDENMFCYVDPYAKLVEKRTRISRLPRGNRHSAVIGDSILELRADGITEGEANRESIHTSYSAISTPDCTSPVTAAPPSLHVSTPNKADRSSRRTFNSPLCSQSNELEPTEKEEHEQPITVVNKHWSSTFGGFEDENVKASEYTKRKTFIGGIEDSVLQHLEDVDWEYLGDAKNNNIRSSEYVKRKFTRVRDTNGIIGCPSVAAYQV